jgi:N-methylhydantoinase A/oxoprolinase/acetone carboxylase beta subunit
MIEEYDSTVVVPPGWRARRDGQGNIVVDFAKAD